MKIFLQKFYTTWKKYLFTDHHVLATSITLAISLLVLSANNLFLLKIIEPRPSAVPIDDYLHNVLLSPLGGVIDFSIAIAFFSISAQLLCFFDLCLQPKNLMLGIRAYTLMVLMRMLVLFFLPLAPPADNILLWDPLVVLFNGVDNTPTKDLFFSGHTATIFMCFLLTGNDDVLMSQEGKKTTKRNISASSESFWVQQNKKKIFLFLSMLLVGPMLIAQHTHYTVDVIAAPFFSYGAYRIVFLYFPGF